jgi:hypothetical protein
MAGVDWSQWMPSGDETVRWRWRENTYGKDISPDCDLELKNLGNGTAAIRYRVTYDAGSNIYATKTENRQVFGVTLAHPSSENLNNCRDVKSVNVVSISRTK